MRVLSRKLFGSRCVVLAMALSSVLAIVGCASSDSSSTGSNITATPTLSPGAGTYKLAQPVTIADATQGAVLYCTTDGTTPTTSSTQCAQPTTVFKSEFLQAIAVAPGKAPSAVVSAGYTIAPDAADAPTFDPAGGTFTGAQTVTIGDATAGTNIYYTTDGTAPSANSTLYTGPVMVSQTSTLSAIAIAASFKDSQINSATYTIQPVLPAPVVSGLSPASANAGGTDLALTVNGSNFVSGATILWNGAALNTTFVGATQLTTTVPASLIASAGTANVIVSQTSGISGASAFTINAVNPIIGSLAPATATAGGGDFVLTVNGSNFVSGATVNWNGAPLNTTFGTAMQLTAAVPANLIAAAGTGSVTVTEPAGTSLPSTFTITLGAPTITSLSSTSTTAGGQAFTLTITGTNFVSGATASWNGTALTTNYLSGTQITAAIPANLIATAGTASITVSTSAGTSPASTFTITAATPTIASLSPTSVSAGGSDFTLTVTGTNFVSGSTVNWNGTPLNTTFGTTTQLTATVPANLTATTGSASVTVTTPAGTSVVSAFTISAPNTPTIGTLSPNSVTAGGTDLTLTITGTNFVSNSTVMWNSTALATTFGSATQLTATLPADLTATAGTASITVTGAAGAVSAASTFTVNAAVPTLASLSPATAAPGAGALTLTLTGTNFDSSAVVNWGSTSTALNTTYVSATQVTAAVTPDLLATTGQFDVTVTTSGGTTASQTFTVAPTINGKVMSGALPINGATVQLYAAGTTGYGVGSNALTMMPATITTDASGNFSLQYFCPTAGAPGDQMYLVATGGDSGSGPNKSIAMMAGLGTCSTLPVSVVVNEVTTIASAYALSAFATINGSGGITVGAPTSGDSCNAASGWQSMQANTCNYTGLVNAFKVVNNLVDLSMGAARTFTPAYTTDLAGDPNILNNSTVPTTRINALADMLATCVESDGTGCGTGLFTAAATTVTTPGAPAPVTPVDTLQAALNIAQNPGNNVPNLLNLVSSTPPYSITSSDAGSMPLVLNGTGSPTDLTLALTFTGAGLGIAPTVTFADGSQGGSVNGAIGIDAAGNIWVGAGVYTSNAYSTIATMIAGFDALGAPLPQTPATTLSSGTPTYGGFNPEPNTNGTPKITSLVVDQSGNLWVNDYNKNILEVNTTPSLFAQPPVPIGNGVANLAIDNHGNAWFINQANPNIGDITPNGSIGVTGPVLFTYYLSYQGSMVFDSNFGLWAAGQNPNFGADVFQLSTSDGSLAYDAFPSNNASPSYTTTLVADGSGFVYGCDETGKNLNMIQAGAVQATYPIATQRACGNQLVLDGQGHIFSVTNLPGGLPGITSSLLTTVDEFTTGGTPISPLANGYMGTSSTEVPTLIADPTWTSGPVPGISAAVDGSGNLWVLNADTFGAADSSYAPLRGNALVEYIGVGAPVVTPTSTALTNGLLGVRP